MNENRKIEDHLTDNEISRVADALAANQYDSLDDRILLHLESCLLCKANAIELTNMLGAMDDSGIPENLDSKIKTIPTKKPVPWKFWLAAASLALLIGSSLYFWQNQKQYESRIAKLEIDLAASLKKDNARINDSLTVTLSEMTERLKEQKQVYADSIAQINVAIENEQKLLATLYAPNRMLEEEMKLVLRAGTISLINPQKRIFRENEKIVFSWEEKTISELDLILYNNKGMAVFQEKGIKNGFVFSTTKLSLGTYYYELHAANEMLYMNKFELK